MVLFPEKQIREAKKCSKKQYSFRNRGSLDGHKYSYLFFEGLKKEQELNKKLNSLT